jgi:hypothetical protein
LLKRAVAALCAAAVLCSLLFAATSAWEDYSDAKGHWAEPVLRSCYENGLIEGYSGKLWPDADITLAESLTIMVRLLGTERLADVSPLEIPDDVWYTEAAAKALFVGLIDAAPADMDMPLTRVTAFDILSRAFELTGAEPDLGVLLRYADGGSLNGQSRRVAAALTERAIVIGDDGYVSVNRAITRAEFMAILTRVLPEHLLLTDTPDEPPRYDGAIFTKNTTLENSELADVYFAGAAAEISLAGSTAGSVTVLSDELSSLDLSGASVGRLTLASKSGDFELEVAEGAAVKTVVIGSGGGSVRIAGDVANVEIVGDDRAVTLNGEFGTVVVFGNRADIVIEEGSSVRELRFLRDCRECTATLDGRVERAVVYGRAVRLTGGESGKLDVLELRDAHWEDAQAELTPSKIVDNREYGIENAVVALTAPEKLFAGNTLRVYAMVRNVADGVPCDGTWLVDGVPVGTFKFTTGASASPELRYNFTYSRDMPASAKIALILRYADDDGKTEMRAEVSVKLGNYSEEYWRARDVERVLALVSTGYAGDYTTRWAETHDYQSGDKEIWVNAMGYTSSSNYLLWVSIKYQRVNIFQRDAAGKWKLLRACLAATGASGTDTPIGVWKTTYKQKWGWTTDTYTAVPVVRFKGGGYAFHSRLYYPNTHILQDPSIGFPVSHGCIRLYDEDIQFIYDYIPDGTTTVVY